MTLSSQHFRFWLFAWLVLVIAACGDSGPSGTGATAGVPGTGGTGAFAGSPGGCAPCNDAGAELAGNGCDDNCNALVDEASTCDSALDFESTNAIDGARAMDVCKGATDEEDWGVLSVAYALPAGEAQPSGQESEFALGHGRLNGFGSGITQVRGGLALLALSSGAARDVDDPGYEPRDGFDKGYTSGQPAGFPVDVPACDGLAATGPADGIALSFEFRAPPNATGFAFDHAFFTADFPNLVCSAFSDVFAVIMDPPPAGALAGNLLQDEDGNPISVNTALIDACSCEAGPPCDAGGLSYACSLGTDILAGTGYESGASTGWLTTRVPIAPSSEFSLTFAIWDSGDGVFDSTALIDNFRWLDFEGDLGTVRAAP